MKLDMHSLVQLDDGREGLLIGLYGGWGEIPGPLDLMLADGSRLHDVERVTKVLRRMPSQHNSAHPKPWPAPWEAAQRQARSDVQTNTRRDAPPLPAPSADTQARTEARLAAIAEGKRLFREAEERARRCEGDPEDVLREALTLRNPNVYVFREWVGLKAARPEGEITFLHSGLWVYTYHRDARRVSQLVELPPTRPFHFAGAWGTAGPAVLEFSDFDHYLEEKALVLTSAGERVAVLSDMGVGIPHEEWLWERPDDVKAHYDAQRARWRQQALDSQVQEKGGAQLALFDSPRTAGIS